VKAISDAYDQTLPRIPDLPGKVRKGWHWHGVLHQTTTCVACRGPDLVACVKEFVLWIWILATSLAYNSLGCAT